MQMSNEEIVRNYREAKDKAKQLGILAELNACDKQKIKDILTEGGIDYRSFPRSKKEKKAPALAEDNKPEKAKRAAVQKKPVNTQCDGDNQTKKKSRRTRKSSFPKL